MKKQAVCYMVINEKEKHWEALCPLVSDFSLEISKKDFTTIDQVVVRARSSFQSYLESFQTMLKLGCNTLSNATENELKGPEKSDKHSFEAMKAKYNKQELYPISYDVTL